MKNLFKHNFILIVPLILFLIFSLSGLDWDHLDERKGIGLDPDYEHIYHPIAYTYDFLKFYNTGYAINFQGWDILLAGFYKITLPIAQKLKLLPEFEVSIERTIVSYAESVVVSVSDPRVQKFFTFLARLFSILMGMLTIIVIYFAGKELFKDKCTGLIAALIGSNVYSFVILSQTAKLYTTLFLAFSISVWFSLRLLKNPSLNSYIWAGLFTGISCSIGITNGMSAIFFVVCHIMVVKDNAGFKLYKYFDKRILLSFIIIVIFFLVLNPRIISNPSYWLSLFYKTVSSRDRIDFRLWHMYSGLFAPLMFMFDLYGKWLTLLIVFGIISSLVTINEIKILMLSLFLFYYCFYFVSPDVFIFLSPILTVSLLAASGLRTFFTRITLYCNSTKTVMILLFALLLIPDYLRIVEQNLINKEKSSYLKASQWENEFLEKKSFLIIPYYGLNCADENGINLKKLIVNRFVSNYKKVEYYAVGRDLIESEILYDGALINKPGTKDMFLPGGIAFGLKESVLSFNKILIQTCKPIKIIEGGRWYGMDHVNIFGHLFQGVPLVDIYPFFKDRACRQHGPQIIYYQLTDDFWSTVGNELGFSETFIEFADRYGLNNINQCSMACNDYKWDPENSVFEFSLTFDAPKGAYAGFFALSLVHQNLLDKWQISYKNTLSKMIRNKMQAIVINHGLTLRADYQYYDTIMLDDKPITRRYKLKVPDNMLKGRLTLVYLTPYLVLTSFDF